MAVLVTGVGYIGARLVEDLLVKGADVVAVDNLFSTDRRVIERLCDNPRFRFVRGNAGRAGVLEQAFESFPAIEAVYSLAAQASAHPQAASARYTENSNLLAPRLLLDAMVRYGVRTLVYASSFRVYGDNLPPVVTESTPYGRFGDLSHLSKGYVEKLMEMYAGRHGLRCLSLRLGVVYGRGPVVKRDYRFMTAPNKFCLQAVRGERIGVYGSGLKPTGFIHVADASQAMQAVASYDALAGYTAINAVTELMPVSDVARIVVEEGRRQGLSVEVSFAGEPEDRAALPEVESTLSALGFRAGCSMRDGVREMIEYFLGAP